MAPARGMLLKTQVYHPYGYVPTYPYRSIGILNQLIWVGRKRDFDCDHFYLINPWAFLLVLGIN
jgi:hypothetical protein